MFCIESRILNAYRKKLANEAHSYKYMTNLPTP